MHGKNPLKTRSFNQKPHFIQGGILKISLFHVKRCFCYFFIVPRETDKTKKTVFHVKRKKLLKKMFHMKQCEF